MAQGLARRPLAAADARGRGYVLFTDADIAWGPARCAPWSAAAEVDDRDLVSQMALLRTATGWERVVVPAFVYFFAQLYPFRAGERAPVADRGGGRRLHAGAPCGALEQSGGLAPISGALHRRRGHGPRHQASAGPLLAGAVRQVVSVRPYPRLADLWQMVARSAYIQLNYSPGLLAGTIIGLLFLYVLPPAGAVIGLAVMLAGWRRDGRRPWLAGAGLAGWALMSLSYLPMLRLYRLSPLRAPGLPLIALLYAAMTVDSRAGATHLAAAAELDAGPATVCCDLPPVTGPAGMIVHGRSWS